MVEWRAFFNMLMNTWVAYEYGVMTLAVFIWLMWGQMVGIYEYADEHLGSIKALHFLIC
jgi:hypothetical protein